MTGPFQPTPRQFLFLGLSRKKCVNAIKTSATLYVERTDNTGDLRPIDSDCSTYLAPDSFGNSRIALGESYLLVSAFKVVGLTGGMPGGVNVSAAVLGQRAPGAGQGTPVHRQPLAPWHGTALR